MDRKMDVDVHKEITYASYINERMAEICDKAETYLRLRLEDKRVIVEKVNAKSGERVVCRYCTRETKRHLAFCATCGKPQVFL